MKTIKRILLILFFIFIINNSYVYAYLANVELNVKDNGVVVITGNSNYELFSNEETNSLTSKNKEYWLFDINTPVFDNFYYSIILPENSKINHISSSNQIRITNIKNKINVIGVGKNENIQIVIQYTIDNSLITNFNYNYLFLFLIILLVIIIINIYYKTHKKEKKINNVLLDALNDRQKQIIEILKKEKVSTQNNLQKKMKIPRASLSRNIKSLKNKDIIEIKRFGLTNKIFLKK